MSVTFRIEGLSEEDGSDLPCPDCGLTLSDAHLRPDRNFDCSCMGYGGPEELPLPRYELNVHEGHAADILSHLGLHYTIGSESPHSILATLALRPLPNRAHGVTLLRIASKAAQYGRLVIWS